MKTFHFFEEIEKLLYNKYMVKKYKICSMYLDERFSINNMGELEINKTINVNVIIKKEHKPVNIKISLNDE